MADDFDPGRSRLLPVGGCGGRFLCAGDGYKGWPEAAPFDAIIVTCAPEKVTQPLIDQLKDGGRMIIPIGPSWDQELVLLRRHGNQLEQRAVLPVQFVPMTGQSQKPEVSKPKNGNADWHRLPLEDHIPHQRSMGTACAELANGFLPHPLWPMPNSLAVFIHFPNAVKRHAMNGRFPAARCLLAGACFF